MIRYIFFFIFCCGFGISLTAQLNIKVGYAFSYVGGGDFNEMVMGFNDANDERLEEKFPDLKFVNGVEIGARYKFPQFAVELSWESLGNSGTGLGEDLDLSLFSKTLYYSFKTLSLGVEKSLGNRSIGLSLGVRNGSIKRDITNGDNKKTLAFDRQYMVKAYWQINFKGADIIGLSIRPYFSYPLNSFNLEYEDDGFQVHDYLQEDGPEILNATSMKLPTVGISLLFYNGWQEQ